MRRRFLAPCLWCAATLAAVRKEGAEGLAEEDFGRHSGLGLAIARAIVEGHGGSIEVEDRTDGASGARFVVRFPGGAE